ncbi:excinuclease ABC subunit C [Candidatus Peregrinibacteria bacterium CG1_02_54_53]|nr:MAG: excinuclease ABC subunit C [Candidatus Peregrinibacteria bacterium CG1_02_54_53]
MFFVYSLGSEDGVHWYVGITDDVQRRLMEHNDGRSVHTNKYRPWRLSSYTAFIDRKRAEKFECYLKSHSGRAFVKRHL